MAIADLQRRMTEVGRIRLGQKTGGRPDRLETFRFTSADSVMIEEIASLYGGEARPWTNDKKQQFEVITDANIIPIYVPPQTIDPFYESWGGAVCLRRCDGIRDLIHDNPCDCDADRRKCKPTTRVNLLLADVQGLGVWRLETHGIYAAGEMAQLSDLVAGIRVPLPARLMLERRGSKRFNREKGKVETLDYNVPVILIDAVTSRTVQLGQDAISQALQAGGHGAPVSAPPAIEAPKVAAIEAPKSPGGPRVDPQMIARALEMIATATPQQMLDIRGRITQSGNPPELITAYEKRQKEHKLTEIVREKQKQAEPAKDPWDAGWTTQHAPVGGYDDEHRDEMRQAAPPGPVQVETPTALPDAPTATQDAPATPSDNSGDRQAALTRLLGVAGTAGFNRKYLDDRAQSDYGVSLKKATAQQLNELAATL